MNEPRPRMTSARPFDTRVQRGEALEHPHRVVRAQHRDGRAEVDALGAAAIAASTTSGAETAKSSRWCSPRPMKSTPSSIGKHGLVDDVADDLRVRQRLAVGAGGDVAEGVQPKLDAVQDTLCRITRQGGASTHRGTVARILPRYAARRNPPTHAGAWRITPSPRKSGRIKRVADARKRAYAHPPDALSRCSPPLYARGGTPSVTPSPQVGWPLRQAGLRLSVNEKSICCPADEKLTYRYTNENNNAHRY